MCRSIVSSFVHPLNALSPIVVTLAVTVFRLVQPANILSLIFVIEAGSSISCRFVHPLKVEPSLISIPSGRVFSISSGRVIVVNFVASLNVAVPLSFFKLRGNWMVVRLEQPETIESPLISLTPSSKVRVLRAVIP